MADLDRLLHKPITGGVFGRGRYALASMPCVARGLHTTRYMVVEPQAGAVLSVAEDKVEALAGARRMLHAIRELPTSNEERTPEQLLLWPGYEAQIIGAPAEARPVSRRRREVFERSQGKCHYCGAVLTLDGKWHVEHMMPRALGGADEMVNLVAACAPCNLAKADRSAIEFVAQSNAPVST